MKLIITLTLVVILFTGCKPKTEHELQQEKIAVQFNPDGSHINLTKWIKDEMNDPESYEHIVTISDEREGYAMFIVEFRGKNAFGAKVKNKLFARVSPTGEILDTSDHDKWLTGDYKSDEEKFLEGLDSLNIK